VKHSREYGRHTVGDDGRNIEENAGNLVWMLLKFFPSQNTVENNVGFWKSSQLHCSRLYGPSIRHTCGTDMRVQKALMLTLVSFRKTQWEKHTLLEPSALR